MRIFAQNFEENPEPINPDPTPRRLIDELREFSPPEVDPKKELFDFIVKEILSGLRAAAKVGREFTYNFPAKIDMDMKRAVWEHFKHEGIEDQIFSHDWSSLRMRW